MQQIVPDLLAYDLSRKKTQTAKKIILKDYYPDVYRKALDVLWKKKELKEYVQYCRKKRYAKPESFSIYVYGCLLP